MLGMKRIVVGQHERALLFRNKQLVEVLVPGVYRFWDPLGRIQVERSDIGQVELNKANAAILMKTAPRLLQDQLLLVETASHQIGAVYRDDKFVAIVPPGERKVYWKVPYELRVELIDTEQALAVPQSLLDTVFRTQGGGVTRELLPYVYVASVNDHAVGLLMVDGEFVQTLVPGFHAFWIVNRKVVVEQLDTRVQAMEIHGQEILSRDKVSLRLNLGVQYQVIDPVKAQSQLQQPLDWIYRELQFALRQAVGSRNLDKLLEDKEQVDREVFQKVADAAQANGFALRSVGLKDVILPGDMKEILNQVVQAEKAAEANVIKRREETAATRSLLNTAKLMDENPTLLRLKELETLEKVTDKVDRLTVFGGLDGVLKDTVKINV